MNTLFLQSSCEINARIRPYVITGILVSDTGHLGQALVIALPILTSHEPYGVKAIAGDNSAITIPGCPEPFKIDRIYHDSKLVHNTVRPDHHNIAAIQKDYGSYVKTAIEQQKRLLVSRVKYLNKMVQISDELHILRKRLTYHALRHHAKIHLQRVLPIGLQIVVSSTTGFAGGKSEIKCTVRVINQNKYNSWVKVIQGLENSRDGIPPLDSLQCSGILLSISQLVDSIVLHSITHKRQVDDLTNFTVKNRIQRVTTITFTNLVKSELAALVQHARETSTPVSTATPHFTDVFNIVETQERVNALKMRHSEDSAKLAKLKRDHTLIIESNAAKLAEFQRIQARQMSEFVTSQQNQIATIVQSIDQLQTSLNSQLIDIREAEESVKKLMDPKAMLVNFETSVYKQNDPVQIEFMRNYKRLILNSITK